MSAIRVNGELFRQYTLLNKSDTDAVYDLIMATANHLQARAEKQYYVGFTGDLDLFLDLDLSALASPWQEFVENFARIRTLNFRGRPRSSFVRASSEFLRILPTKMCGFIDAQRPANNGVTPRWPISSVASLNCKKELPNFLPFRGNAKAQLEQFGSLDLDQWDRPLLIARLWRRRGPHADRKLPPFHRSPPGGGGENRWTGGHSNNNCSVMK
jgi:hypothetical protein